MEVSLNTTAVLMHVIELQFRTVSIFFFICVGGYLFQLVVTRKTEHLPQKMANKSQLLKNKSILGFRIHQHHISPALMVLSLTLPVENHIYA